LKVRELLVHLLLTSLIAAPVESVCFAQADTATNSKSNWYSALPEPEQGPFRLNLDHVISLTESGKWDELYDFRQNDQKLTKAQFAKRMNALDRLVWFHPSSMYYVPGVDKWVLTGCARYRRASGKEEAFLSEMREYHSNGKWMFDGVAIALTDSGIVSCKN